MSGVGSKVLLGIAGATEAAAGCELSSALLGATGEPFGVGVRVGVNDDPLGEFSAFSKISSRGETAGFGDTKSIGDLVLVLKTESKSVQ